LRRLAIALLALAVFAVGCSAPDDEVARVGETVVHLSDISRLYVGNTLPVDESFRETLFRVVAVDALTQALAAQYGVTVSSASVESYYSQLEANRTLANSTPAQFLGVANASQEMVHFNAELLALRDAAIDVLMVDPAVVDNLFANPATLTTVCVKQILVATQEEADAVKARLEDGEDFATVAGEVSLDTSSEGGDLGCGLAAVFVPEFAQAALEAPLGEVYGPVQSEAGFHVIIVTERTTPTREEYLAYPKSVLDSQTASDIWIAWLNDALQAADVWVSERYGTWTPVGINPPASESTTTTAATTTSGG
jgi:foldase protein PrsA